MQAKNEAYRKMTASRAEEVKSSSQAQESGWRSVAHKGQWEFESTPKHHHKHHINTVYLENTKIHWPYESGKRYKAHLGHQRYAGARVIGKKHLMPDGSWEGTGLAH
jgi:hypothetical protein